ITWAGKPFNKVVDGVNWITCKLGVKKKIGKWAYPQYAKGTKGAHPGGLVKVNDGRGSWSGRELIRFPDGTTAMIKDRNNVTILTKVTHIISNSNTRDILQ